MKEKILKEIVMISEYIQVIKHKINRLHEGLQQVNDNIWALDAIKKEIACAEENLAYYNGYLMELYIKYNNCQNRQSRRNSILQGMGMAI